LSLEFSRDRKYAIITFKSSEDAAAALVLDGIKCNGKALEIRRPKDREDFGINNVSPNVMEGPNKVIPYDFNMKRSLLEDCQSI
jgi:hypothetical protein